MDSENLARRLNQSRASAVLQSNLIAIKFGKADARLNWAFVHHKKLQNKKLYKHFFLLHPSISLPAVVEALSGYRVTFSVTGVPPIVIVECIPS